MAPTATNAIPAVHLLGHRIDQGRLELTAILGVGAYGVVYRAIDATGRSLRPRNFAVKCLLKASLDTRQRQFQRREIALHQLASAHRNVVTMYKTIEEGDYVFVILDYCEDGDLFGMITERQRYVGDDLLIKRVFLQILDAVEYCHSLGIYHRDLKPENIICANGGENVYLADFGLATAEKKSTDFGCGSTFYMSPECQGGLTTKLDSYSTPANDIWSLGIILVNLTCGRNPWRQACTNDETFRAFLQGENFLRSILPISHNLNYILRHIFTPDPAHRITLKQLRSLVLDIDTFTMSDSELRQAHAAAQAAHAAVAKPTRASLVHPPLDAPRPHFVQAPILPQPPRFDVPESRTPLLAINRTRSSSGDGSSSLPPTPQASAQDPTELPSCFELDVSNVRKPLHPVVRDLRIQVPQSPDFSNGSNLINAYQI